MRGQWRRVNSLEYFRRGIEPRWEDPRNAQGGRFVFPVSRAHAAREALYADLVFFLLGEDFAHSGHVCGFRFISPKNSLTGFRVEVWVDFADDALELLRHFQTLLTSLFKTLSFDAQSVTFLNNRLEPGR